MATASDVARWLAGYTSMPGWSFELVHDDRLHFPYIPTTTLVITHETPNADEPPRPRADLHGIVTHYADTPCGPPLITVGSRSVVPLEMLPDRRSFYAWLWQEQVERMKHELLEWGKVQGQRIFDPHPEGRTGRTAYRPDHYRLAEQYDGRDDSFASARFGT